MYKSKSSLYAIIASSILIVIILSYFLLKFNKSHSHTLSFAHEYSLEKLVHKNNVIPLAIIGSGPAGLSAALYGARGKIYMRVVLKVNSLADS